MYHMRLGSFYEVSLPVGSPRRCRSEKLPTPAPSLIYGLPPSTCATRRLGAFIHNAADIRMRGQGDPYNHHIIFKISGIVQAVQVLGL